MKKLYYSALIITFLLTSCANRRVVIDQGQGDDKSATSLCEGTGGTLDGFICTCSGEKCAPGLWCDITGKCATGQELSADALCVASGGVAQDGKCVCSGETCAAGALCNLDTKKCPQSAINDTTFADLCTVSGGEMAGEFCKCAGEICAAERICTADGVCSTEDAPETTTTCINGPNYVGMLRTCIGEACTVKECSVKMGDNDVPVSCSGTTCGTCLNYKTTCEDDTDPAKGGSIFTCREGKKVLIRECENNFSCLAKTCSDPGCAGELLCGECHEGEFRCENGNVPENFNYLNHSGANITLPQGFITGMRSKCIGGQWQKLALDDPENCFFGHLPDNKLPSIKVGTEDIVTVYGYNSYGSSTGRKYAVSSCMEDGINCGECTYSFAYCSGSKYYTCLKGRVEESLCQGSGGMCYSNNSCYAYSTDAYCTGNSCQNCKSICNW